MTNSEKRIERIKALLAKEGAGGTTPEEVAAALAAANRLLEREGLERAQLELDGAEETEEPQVFTEPLDASKRVTMWRGDLAMALAQARGCFVYKSRGLGIMIVGTPSSASTVRYLYSYCVREIDRITSLEASGMGKVYANSFRLGCNDAIRTAINAEREKVRAEERAAVANDCTALVSLDKAIARLDNEQASAQARAEESLRLKNAQSTRYSVDASARVAGQRAGAGIYPGTGGNAQLGTSKRALNQ